MARFNDDFDSYSVGAGLMTGWTNHYDASNVSLAVVADGDSPGGQAFQITKSGAGRPLFAKDITDGNNQSALALLEVDSDNQTSVWINAGGGTGTETGYFAELDLASNRLELWRANGNGTFTNLNNGTFTLSSGTMYWVRVCRFSDGRVTGRIWAHGSDEPAAWTCSSTGQNAYTSGWAGVSVFASSGVSLIHRLSVGTEWDVGCVVDDDALPTEGFAIQTATDFSVRLLNSTATALYVIAIFNQNNGPQQVAFHRVKEKFYVTCNGSASQAAIFRIDRYGTSREVIRSTLTNLFGITFDYDNNRIFYTVRAASGSLYSNHEDGGSESLLVSSISWPGHPYWDGNFVYVPYNHNVRRYTAAGSLDTTYGTLNEAHCVIVDGTNVVAGSWSTVGLWYIPVGGGSWTNADSSNKVWQIDLDEDNTTIYGAAFDVDTLFKWVNMPPPASGNRSTVYSGSGADTIHSVSYFTITVPPTGGPQGGLAYKEFLLTPKASFVVSHIGEKTTFKALFINGE